MSRTTMAWDGVLEGETERPSFPDESAWRTFLRSWKLGGILAVACVLGVAAILATHPFATSSVSQRVSDTVGRNVSCSTAGVAVVSGKETTVYRCGAAEGTGGQQQCFTVSGPVVKQISGNRNLGC